MNIVVLQLSDAFRGVYYNMEAEGASACVPVAEGGQAGASLCPLSSSVVGEQ